MKFRKQALRHLEAPEQLDRVVRLATVPAWLLTGALVIIVVVAGTWASVGTVPRTVHAGGVLIHASGVSDLDATTSGQLVKVWVAPNQLATTGSPLYTVQDANGQLTTVNASWDAYVVSILVSQGQLLEPGTPVANLEQVNGPDDAFEAVVFVAAAAAPGMRPGGPVELSASAASSAVFGTLSGVVESVGAFPETADSLRAFLGRGVDTTPYLDKGAVMRVVIRIRTEPGSPTTLVWSKSNPPFQLNSESAVTATFTIDREHPISWLLGSD
jgi:multidrug efflux pump subunit AcrA (membrane-fusion protein)